MSEKKRSEYHKYLNDLVNIDKDLVKKIREEKQKLAEENKKKKQYEEDLQYQRKYRPIQDCLMDIMNDAELLEAVKKYGRPIRFAEGSGSHRKYEGYGYLELDLENSRSSKVNLYLVNLRTTPQEDDIELNRSPFVSKLYVKDNKVLYNFYGHELDAAKAIRHEYWTENPAGIKKHDAESIYLSLENAIKKTVNNIYGCDIYKRRKK